MSNRDKANFKIDLWKSEIKELEYQVKMIDQQINTHTGANRANLEALNAVTGELRKLKQSMDWTDKKNRKDMDKPDVVLTGAQGEKVALFLKPLQTLFKQKADRHGDQPAQLNAQKSIIESNISRLKKKIEIEDDKDYESEYADEPRSGVEDNGRANGIK